METQVHVNEIVQIVLFQSNLRGMETKHLGGGKGDTEGFNRTLEVWKLSLANSFILYE